jgi:hypothetical protein
MGCIYMSLNSFCDRPQRCCSSRGFSRTLCNALIRLPTLNAGTNVSLIYIWQKRPISVLFLLYKPVLLTDCWVSALGFLDPLNCPEKLQAGTKSLIPSRRICSHSLHSGHHDNCIKRGEMKEKWWIQWKRALIVDIRKKNLYNPVALHSLCGICGKY